MFKHINWKKFFNLFNRHVILTSKIFNFSFYFFI